MPPFQKKSSCLGEYCRTKIWGWRALEGLYPSVKRERWLFDKNMIRPTSTECPLRSWHSAELWETKMNWMWLQTQRISYSETDVRRVNRYWQGHDWGYTRRVTKTEKKAPLIGGEECGCIRGGSSTEDWLHRLSLTGWSIRQRWYVLFYLLDRS